LHHVVVSKSKLFAISKISSLNKPFRAGRIKDTAEARLTQRLGEWGPLLHFLYELGIELQESTDGVVAERVTKAQLLT
jgi:hypothetical protein